MSETPRVDEERLFSQLMELAEVREPEQPGWTRRTFSEPYRRSRQLVRELMEEAGLGVQVDVAGNLLGRLPGAQAGLPQIAIGSHTDTVAGGGRFDGMAGVLGAIELVRVLRAAGQGLRHPLLVVDFLGEEPNRFGLSCLGSRAVSGALEPHLGLRDGAGETLGEALSAFGARPRELGSALWEPDRLLGYLELHIEQGRRLEEAGVPLGVVTAICGVERAEVRLTGRADHAGTTPMGRRRDALAGAAELVLGLERLAAEAPGGVPGVGTVGRLEVLPGASNVVPGWSRLWAELRSPEPSWLERAAAGLEAEARRVGAERELEVELEWISREAPVRCHEGLRRLLRDAISELGQSQLELESWAGHDAALVARLCPAAMLFVPSRGGRSHCPEEWTEPAQVALGVEALLAAVLALDRAGEV